MIKRIIKFVPNSEYMNFYDALLSYCISSCGAIPHSKLQGIFAFQKRCIRLLFGLEYSFDHAGYYETCARSRTYQDHITKKNYILEHTKPLFNRHNILNLFNLFTYHTILDIFKILKTQVVCNLAPMRHQKTGHCLIWYNCPNPNLPGQVSPKPNQPGPCNPIPKYRCIFLT